MLNPNQMVLIEHQDCGEYTIPVHYDTAELFARFLNSEFNSTQAATLEGIKILICPLELTGLMLPWLVYPSFTIN